MPQLSLSWGILRNCAGRRNGVQLFNPRAGLQPRDDSQISLGAESGKGDVTGRILSALNEAIRRCRGPEESWMAQDLKRAMVLIGGLDEEVAQRILDQEGV